MSRICLGLDTLIHFPPEDVVPAIQDRLYDLLSHNSSVCTGISCLHLVFSLRTHHHYSPHVRRRALLVYRVLSKQDTDILRHIVDKTRKRFEDSDSIVVSAAVALGLDLITVSWV